MLSPHLEFAFCRERAVSVGGCGDYKNGRLGVAAGRVIRAAFYYLSSAGSKSLVRILSSPRNTPPGIIVRCGVW